MPPTNAEYAKINIACKELNLDKYQLLEDRFRVSSSKQLTRSQVWNLLEHFKRLGWKVKRSKKKTTSPKYKDRQRRKIVGLWISLSKAGVIRNRSDLALQGYVKRITRVTNLAWCDEGQVQTVCQSLIEWCKREDIDPYAY